MIKQTTKRKLVLGREVVKALMTELPPVRLREARGGEIVSAMGDFGCTHKCPTIEQ
jgi:hypothetical protein